MRIEMRLRDIRKDATLMASVGLRSITITNRCN